LCLEMKPCAQNVHLMLLGQCFSQAFPVGRSRRYLHLFTYLFSYLYLTSSHQ
jgi:hypothetical protein